MDIKKVYISKNAIEDIERIIINNGNDTEVGGCLVGCEINQELLITHVSPPGPNSKRSRYSIDIDNKFTTQFSNELNKCYDNKIYYLGDWHTHLSSNLRPSSTDIKALKKLNDYVPIVYKNSIVSMIINHFSFTKYKIYKLNDNEVSLVVEVPSEIIENPEWLVLK